MKQNKIITKKKRFKKKLNFIIITNIGKKHTNLLQTIQEQNIKQRLKVVYTSHNYNRNKEGIIEKLIFKKINYKKG